MKKAILIIAVLLLVGSFVFAQDAGVKIGAWGRGVFIPVQGGSDITAVDQTSWGGQPRVGLTISGSSANVGFQVDFNGDNGGINAGDQQKIWIKPLDMATIQIGKIYDDTLRGGVGFGAWNWVRFSTMSGDDAIFGRLGVDGQKNLTVALAPIEGLYLYAGFGGKQSILGAAETLTELFTSGQYGAGYTIAGIGTLRAQYIGTFNTKKDAADKDVRSSGNYGVINAAFKLTAVEKLTADVGAFIPVDADTYGSQAKVALMATYGIDALTINAMGNVNIPKTGDTGLEFAAGVDYNLGDGLGVTLDGNFNNAASAGAKFPNGAIGGLLAITKGFSNGLIGIGVEVTTGGFAGGLASTDSAAWMVPVRFEYWF